MQFGSAPVLGRFRLCAQLGIDLGGGSPLVSRSRRATCSDGRGSYPGRSRLGPERATIVANDGYRPVLGHWKCRQPLSRQALWRRHSCCVGRLPGCLLFPRKRISQSSFDPKGPGSLNSTHGLILFDGVCVLCSHGRGFVSKHDRRAYFRMVPMQLAEARDWFRALVQSIQARL